MVLPTGLTTFTPVEHAAYHNELHTVLSWYGFPTSLTTGNMTTHMGHHNAMHAQVSSRTLNMSKSGGHVAAHNALHTYANGSPTITGPTTISAGGTYSFGVYESTSAATPAITIATTAAVTIDRAFIKHKGFGIFAEATTGTNVTITNCTFVCTAPPSVTNQLGIYLLQPASFVFEHNRLLYGHGVLLNGDHIGTNPLRIRYNDYVDIGRFDAPELVGAVHFDKVSAPSGAEIAWNRVQNHYGLSVSEDVIGIVDSDGASGNLINVHDNLIDGSYPYTGDGAGFTGGGIDFGDIAGSFQVAHDNTVVRVTNNGIMVPAGTDLEYYSNRIVNSGIADNGSRVSSTFGNGLNLWDNPGYVGVPARVSMHDNVGDHRRWTGSAWERSWQNTPACDPAGACINNTNIGLNLTTDSVWLAEVNDAIADWEVARAAAGVTVGHLF